MYLLRGLWHERHEQFLLARSELSRGPGAFSGSEALRVAMGRVDFTLTRWNEVIPLLAGISHGPAQTEAAYYYGVVLAEASPLRFEARNALNNAVRNPAFAVAARYELAMLNAREGNLAEAAKVMDQITMEPAAGSASDPRARRRWARRKWRFCGGRGRTMPRRRSSITGWRKIRRTICCG